MLRRPPTVIPLTEDDLQFHLQRTFARSLPVNINHLSLEDADQNYAERDPDPTSEEQHSSLNKPAGQLDQQRPLHGSTGGMTHSSLMAARMHPAALHASMMTGSTHRTIVDPNRAPTAAATAQLISSNNIPQTRASRLREASPSPPRTELTIPPQEFLDRHILPSPGRKKVRPVRLLDAKLSRVMIIISPRSIKSLTRPSRRKSPSWSSPGCMDHSKQG